MAEFTIARLPARIVARVAKQLKIDTILGPSGDPVANFTAVPGAVNSVTITNAVDGTSPSISATDGLDLTGTVTVNGAAPATVSATQTLTSKTINLASNTLTGTITGFNNACSDADFATLTGAETLTNKRITPRGGFTASSATPSINTDNVDLYILTALATNITSMTSGLSGTPTSGQRLQIRFKDDGTARTITWGTKFVGNLLGTTVATKTHLQDLVYDSTLTKWAGTYVDTVGY